MNSMALALRIRGLREQKGKSQEQVSQMLKISRQAYIRLEQGKRNISFIDITKIADFLGINYRDITDFTDERRMSLMSLCRNEGLSPESEKAFDTIDKLLGIFSAQEQLYYRIKENDHD